MNKKIIVLIVVGVIVLIGTTLGIYFYLDMNKVYSVVTIDINPSIKFSLNKNNKVLDIEGLNEEGKELIRNKKYVGELFNDAFSNITKEVVEKKYITEENNYILVNIDGKNNEEHIVSIINNEFKNNSIECNVIIQEITEEAKENASKYGISESKASYIEKVIKDNPSITFEELKDKSINEINNNVINNDKTSKDEQSKEQVSQEQQSQIENKNEEKQSSVKQNDKTSKNDTKSTQKKKTLTQPANDDRTGAWCDFLKSIPSSGGVKFETPGKINDLSTFKEAAKKYVTDDINWNNSGGSESTYYKTGSYCSAGFIEVENRVKDKAYQIYIDSVTLELLELKVIEIAKPTIDETAAKEIAKKWAQEKYGIDIDNCGSNPPQFYYAIDGITRIPEWQFSLKCENPTKYYGLNINALTGALSHESTW